MGKHELPRIAKMPGFEEEVNAQTAHQNEETQQIPENNKSEFLRIVEIHADVKPLYDVLIGNPKAVKALISNKETSLSQLQYFTAMYFLNPGENQAVLTGLIERDTIPVPVLSLISKSNDNEALQPLIEGLYTKEDFQEYEGLESIFVEVAGVSGKAGKLAAKALNKINHLRKVAIGEIRF